MQILPECYGDTALIEMLEYKNPYHLYSISRVLTTLSDKRRKSQTLIGIIDNDKRKPEIYNEYIKEFETENMIRKKHPDRNHYLFILNPALEKFLFGAAEQADVDPAKYGFNNIEHLKKTCKNKNVQKNQNFKQFVNAIKQKKKSSCVKTLKNWLNELLGDDY
ncbi:MAG TPA: hypothetical protein ENJ95_00765 [Bacteroidetes bacterium]|nr:hypothetical protein [Bacteroidota bacterium]